MKEMRLKKIRRQCFVPGCRNTDSMIVTRSREGRVGVILCQTCMKELASFVTDEEEKDVLAADPAATETAKTDGVAVAGEMEADGEGGVDGSDEKATDGDLTDEETAENEKEATDAPSVLPDDVTAAADAPVEESAPPVTKTRARKPAATAKKPGAKRSGGKTPKEGNK